MEMVQQVGACVHARRSWGIAGCQVATGCSVNHVKMFVELEWAQPEFYVVFGVFSATKMGR